MCSSVSHFEQMVAQLHSLQNDRVNCAIQRVSQNEQKKASNEPKLGNDRQQLQLKRNVELPRSFLWYSTIHICSLTLMCVFFVIWSRSVSCICFLNFVATILPPKFMFLTKHERTFIVIYHIGPERKASRINIKSLSLKLFVWNCWKSTSLWRTLFLQSGFFGKLQNLSKYWWYKLYTKPQLSSGHF